MIYAGVVQAYEHELTGSSESLVRPFHRFSDLLMSVAVTRFGFTDDEEHEEFFCFDQSEIDVSRISDALVDLGFEFNELGASKTCVPLEMPSRKGIALISAPTESVPEVCLRVRIQDRVLLRHISEIFQGC